MLLGVIIDSPDDVIYFPGQGPIELSCNVSSGIVLWMVNGSTYTLSDLQNGTLANHNHNGINIIIEAPVNGTEYVCVEVANDENIRSRPVFVYIAGEYIHTYECTCIFWYH